jgi:hypothetical protein
LHGKSYAKLDDEIVENLLNDDYIAIYNYVKRCFGENKQPFISSIFDMFDVDNNYDVAVDN